MSDGGYGSQSPRVDFYPNVQFSVPFCPILASVSFRQLPPASVDFRLHHIPLDIPSLTMLFSSPRTTQNRTSQNQSFYYYFLNVFLTPLAVTFFLTRNKIRRFYPLTMASAGGNTARRVEPPHPPTHHPPPGTERYTFILLRWFYRFPKRADGSTPL